MPIIIDNFQVNINAPIDNRFVVGGSDSFYSHRNDIVHKYQGLRIWDLNDHVPYYWDGTNWVSENAIGVSADVTADINYIAKFTTGSTIIGKSLLYENISTSQIGLGIIGSSISANTTFTGTSLNNAGGLHVAGNIKTNNYFVGNGCYITDINASNINSGSLNVQYISSSQAAGFPQVSLGQYVLFNTGTVNGVSWVATNTLTVLNSTNTTNVNIIDDTSTPIVPNNYITFVQHNSGNLPIYTSSGKIQFNPGTGQLFLGNGDVNNPVYSFINNTNTGIYYDGNINFTIGGVNRVSISPGIITIYDSNYAQINFYKSSTDIQKLFVGQGNILKYRTNAWDSNNSVQVASDNVVWHSGNLYTLRDSGNLSIESGRNINSQSFDATGALIKGVYTYNYYGAPPLTTINTPISNVFTNTLVGNIGVSQNNYFSVLSFGRGDLGSVQLASNWAGVNAQGNVVADREILIRSLKDTNTDTWSPWVKIWNSGNSGYVPFGAILMWSGTIAQIPSGWTLCDGRAAVTIPARSVPGQPLMTSITIPDLRERFVVGAGIETGKIIKDYSAPFTIQSSEWPTSIYVWASPGYTVPAPSSVPYTADTTNPYYVDTNGKLRQGANIDGYSYHLYKGTGSTTSSTFRYIVYDNRFNTYIIIQGALVAVGNSVTGQCLYGGDYKGDYKFYKPLTIPTTFPMSDDTYEDYTKYFTKGRRIAWKEIVWQTTLSTGYNVGDKGGQDKVTLLGSHAPKHQHDATSGEHDAPWAIYGAVGGNNFPGAYDSDNQRYLTSAYGNNEPHENRPPYYALAFIIYTGI